MEITTIGKCKGCTKMSVLDNGVCKECLNDPDRGRDWANAMNRARTSPEFAMKVWKSLDNDYARERFIKFFGLPKGVVYPNKLSSV